MTAEASEWLKIMLQEIARKKAEAEQILTEDLRRRGEAKAAADANTGGNTNSGGNTNTGGEMNARGDGIAGGEDDGA